MIDQNVGKAYHPPAKSLEGTFVETQDALVREHFQIAATFWEDIYSQNDVYAAIHQQRRAAVLSFVDRLALPRKSEVLDIGCGAGSISVALASRGLSVKAVDQVPRMLELTNRLALQAGVSKNIATSVGNIHHLAFPDSSFSAALAIGVLPWLSVYETPLREIARVVKPGGYIVINIDNRWALHRLLNPGMNFMLTPLKSATARMLNVFVSRKPAPTNTTMSVKRFHHLLRSRGFEPLQGVMFGFGPFSLFQHCLLPDSLSLTLHRKLQELCDRGAPPISHMGAQYLVLAQKQ